MDFSLEPIYQTKTREELIKIITLKNEQLLKQDYEIERLDNLNKLIKTKLDESLKGNITIDPIVNRIIKKHLDNHIYINMCMWSEYVNYTDVEM